MTLLLVSISSFTEPEDKGDKSYMFFYMVEPNIKGEKPLKKASVPWWDRVYRSVVQC